MNVRHLIDKWRLRLHQNFRTSKNKRVFWIMMTPSYDNLGDSGITQATVDFLADYFPEFEIREVNELTRSWQYSYLEKKIMNDDILILPGGGNFGEIWPVTELIRQGIVQRFSGKKMISFPQSYSFQNEKSDILKSARQIYTNRVDLFFFRDSYSKKSFQSSFTIDSALSPDIVMYTFSKFKNGSNENIKSNDVLTILRDDKEKKNNSQRDQLIGILNLKWEVMSTDTKPIGGQLITQKNRQNLINQKLKQIKSSGIVVTDRLHGLIFSRSQGIPVVFFGNSDGKVVNLFNTWLKDDSGILYADDKALSDIEMWIEDNINKVIPPKNFDQEFSNMKNEISKRI